MISGLILSFEEQGALASLRAKAGMLGGSYWDFYHRPVANTDFVVNSDPTARPPLQLVPTLRLLADWGVSWVLTGSTVLAIYGARLLPNDLDVTPALAPDNLQRLAGALQDVDAIPAYVPDWGMDQDQCQAWSPQPATEQNLDHLFVTRLGMVDVPPRLCGTYDELVEQATRVDIGGVPVQVCALSEVLARLQGRTRTKDLRRAGIYEEMSRQAAHQPTPVGVPWLIERLVHVPPLR